MHATDPSSFTALCTSPKVSGAAPSPGPSDVTTVTSIRGTYGYLSPEYLEKGHASVRADIFAFGVVLLEILTGLQPVDTARGRGVETLGDWLRPRLRNPDQMLAMLDPPVSEQASAVQVAVMCEIAEACLRHNPRERPSMLDVVRTLSAVSSFSESTQQRGDSGAGSGATSSARPPLRRTHLPSYASAAAPLPLQSTAQPRPETVSETVEPAALNPQGVMRSKGRLSGRLGLRIFTVRKPASFSTCTAVRTSSLNLADQGGDRGCHGGAIGQPSGPLARSSLSQASTTSNNQDSRLPSVNMFGLKS